MIIWGSRGREIEQERGQFHCPDCDAAQEYRQMRVATYFTLYFIPLFETQHHGDYIECLGCGGQYNPVVLDYTPPSPEERAVHSIRADLESGTPLQMARTKLTNTGVEPAVADRLVAAAAQGHQRVCRTCQLTFVAGVSRCSACGKMLQGQQEGAASVLDVLPADDDDRPPLS